MRITIEKKVFVFIRFLNFLILLRAVKSHIYIYQTEYIGYASGGKLKV